MKGEENDEIFLSHGTLYLLQHFYVLYNNRVDFRLDFCS